MATLTNPLTANGDYTLSAKIHPGKKYVVTANGTWNGATVAVQTDIGAGNTTITDLSFTADATKIWTCNAGALNVNVSSAGASTSVYVRFSLISEA